MEIGSIYEINPDTVKTGAEGGLHLAQMEKYGRAHCCFTASGREAIELALISLEREKPDLPKRCLMPAYMCDSVFLPFLNRGWELVFYTVDRGLLSYGEELFRLALETDPGLILIHPYYGTDTCKEMRVPLKALRRSGIYVMEDVTQSYYLEGAGKDVDFVVGSLRKWYAIPDGGFVVSDLPLAEDVLEDGEEQANERLSVLTEKWAYLYDGARSEETKRQEKKAAYRKKNCALEEALDHYTGVRRMSRVTRAMLAEIDEAGAAQKRKENYQYLYEKIEGLRRLRPILQRQGGEAPLYLPIYAREREELQSFLRDHDIYAPVLWPLGEENRNAFMGDEDYIHRHMLALPIDQRYGIDEMERIGEVLTKFERRRVVGIRADANKTAAIGHIMRCITIAGELKKRGMRVVFFTADEWPKEALTTAGMEQICLHTRWDWMEEELPRLGELITRLGVGTLLVDSYQVSPAYFEALRDQVKLVYLDDCFEAVYPVDLLINYNAFYTRFPYYERYGEKTKLLLGTSYVPLREEFSQAAEEIRQEESARTVNGNGFSIFLASGGGDSENAMLGILKKLVEREAFADVMIHVVIGAYYPRGDEMKAFADAHANVRVYHPCRNVAALMKLCDAAASAAGTMLFELSAMQVPTVFFQTADNQRYDSEFFSKEERMIDAGDIRKDREACLNAVCVGLEQLLADGDLRARMREKLLSVTDGKGAERIAEEIAKL
ncbi:MAG: UDP-2,4-diacetamido-2,4,6-trideoxy-beta-L-altropyranose hydrolase [Lachnospiraceae bacterium]|nr:UDP-2,4-diacetamido-2,4,6-trideoxy-beta-L-altropyranose hydrolase [Lachnospiraceae bacterium]